MKMKFILIFFFFYLAKCQLSIIGPTDLNSQFSNSPIDIVFKKMTDSANFYVNGEVFFENVTKEHNACQDLGTLATNTNQNQFSENFKILLAYKGACPIFQKARNAQSAGATMLVLINDNSQNISEVILEEDVSGSEIKIPVGLISLYNGRILHNYIDTYPKNRIMVEINIQPTNPKKRVELKLFFSSSELRAYQLLSNLTAYLDKYDDQVTLIPIYVTHQIPAYDPNNAKRENNCVSKGKYCYFPKETTITQDGTQILLESLRQKCMYQKSKKSKKIKYYFDYMDKFYKNCLSTPITRFNDKCSKEILDIMGFNIDYLDECVADSFGVKSLLSSSYADNENYIFKNDYLEIIKYKLSSFPAVVVDDQPIEGIIKEYKVAVALCDAVKVKPAFCTFLSGTVIESNPTRSWTFFLIVVIIIINLFLFIVFRKYIRKRIGEKINLNMIEVNGRVNNILTNFFRFRRQDNDYQSFGKDGMSINRPSTQIEGAVNTI